MARETTTQNSAAAEMAELSVRPVGGGGVGDQEKKAGGVCPPDTKQLHDYETQFFRFTPETCMVRIFGAFQESLYDMLLTVESLFVRQKLQNNNSSAAELRGGRAAADHRDGDSGEAEEERLRRARECSQKLQEFLHKRFQRLEARMKTLLTNNCFTIPANVLLTEDEQHRNPQDPQDLQEVLRLESSMAELQRAYEAEVCGRQALLAELEEQRETQELLDGVLKWVEETTEMTKEDGAAGGRFQGSVQQVKEAIKKLEDCVAEIYHKAPHTVSRGAK